ncbi:DUF2797 domain-containing protein, partial [Bacteroidales bacterium OttesenSCG-928-I21]|nr:DUF2797 domain-containing protein [Bacteroidales bacterium OttesenSCG-928-I21]
MRTEYNNPVSYFLSLGNKSEIPVNKLIGKQIKIEFQKQINCIACNTVTKTSFHQGYCYSCFISLPQTDEGILKPEKD